MKSKLKTFVCSLCFLLAASSLFAVDEYVSKIYKDIDQIFVDRSEELLGEILQQYQNDKNYYLIENYAQKKIRRLILNNEYNFAMSAIIVVIENDLDNEEALEMYTVISDAFEEQKRLVAVEKEVQQQEVARIEQAKDKQRNSVDKEYIGTTTASGKTVYVGGAEARSSSTSWKFNLGMMPLAQLMDTASGISGLNYGIAVDYAYEYFSDTKVLGVDADADFRFSPVGDTAEKAPLIVNFDFVPKFAVNSISKKLFFRCGMAGILTGVVEDEDNPDAKSELVGKFYSPVVGLGLERIALGNMNLDMALDYFAGHLLYEDINCALGGQMNLSIPFAETEMFNMKLNVGVKDQFFMKTSGIENRASLILAIGAENVVR